MSNPAITQHATPRTAPAAALATARVATCLLSLLIGVTSLRAQPPRSAKPRSAQASPGPVQQRAAARLSAPLRTSVESRPVRELLTQLAEVAEVNLWIDRRVDPDRLVSLDREPRTLFGAIVSIAESVDAEAVVVNDLVLVGPRETVHALLGLMLAARDPALLDSPPISLGWPEASTPAEALQHVVGDLAVGEDLPHDLWPAVRWQGVSVPLAILLVTAQFDRMPADNPFASPNTNGPNTNGRSGLLAGAGAAKPGLPEPAATDESATVVVDDRPAAAPPAGGNSDRPASPPSASSFDSGRAAQTFRWSQRLVPLSSPTTLVVSHPGGSHASDLRRAVTAADPRAWVKPTPANRRLEVGGSPAAQAAAIRQTLTRLAPQAASKLDLDKVRFTLNLRGVPAATVFAHLAMTADHTLMIEPDAQAACQTLVMLDANDRTLRELAMLVAEQIGVRTDWSDGRLRISRR